MPYGTPQAQQTGKPKGFAITSMILGLVALVNTMFLFLWGGTLFYIFAVALLLSIIFGTIALLKAMKSPAQYGGKGFAITGLGLCLVCVLVYGLMAAYFSMRSNSRDIYVSTPSRSNTSSSAPLATAIQGKWKTEWSAVYNFANGRWTTDYAGGMAGSYKIIDEQTIERDDDRTRGRAVTYKVVFSGNTMTTTDRTGAAIVYTRVY